MSENRISIDITREDLDAISQAVQVINTRLEPYLIALDAEDKRNLPKIGERNYSFVEKCVEYAESNPEFTPPYVKAPELRKDFTSFTTLNNLLRPLEILIANISDTAMLCGADAADAASSYYRSVRDANEKGVVSARPIYEDLSVRYEAQRAPRPRRTVPTP